MPDSCIVFGCNHKSDPENGITLHRIPFFNGHRPDWVIRRKKWIDFAISHCLCLFHGQIKCWGDVTRETRPILLYYRPWAKKALNFLALKLYNIWRKNPESNFCAIVNRAVARVYLRPQKIGGASGTLRCSQCGYGSVKQNLTHSSLHDEAFVLKFICLVLLRFPFGLIE